jgi:hypothetical protein
LLAKQAAANSMPKPGLTDIQELSQCATLLQSQQQKLEGLEQFGNLITKSGPLVLFASSTPAYLTSSVFKGMRSCL